MRKTIAEANTHRFHLSLRRTLCLLIWFNEDNYRPGCFCSKPLALFSEQNSEETEKRYPVQSLAIVVCQHCGVRDYGLIFNPRFGDMLISSHTTLKWMWVTDECIKRLKVFNKHLLFWSEAVVAPDGCHCAPAEPEVQRCDLFSCPAVPGHQSASKSRQIFQSNL